MSRQKFQVVLSQALGIGIVIVQYMTESSLPPELLYYLSQYETILIADRYAVIEVLTNVPFLIHTGLGILSAVGLILFRAWGRSVFLVYIVAQLIISVLTGPHVDTGLTVFTGYVCSLVEGAIVALIYFSPVKDMFEIEA